MSTIGLRSRHTVAVLSSLWRVGTREVLKWAITSLATRLRLALLAQSADGERGSEQ